MVLYAVLLFGLALVCIAAYSVAAGGFHTRWTREWISKDDEPRRFWLHVVLRAVAGLFFAGAAGFALWHQ